MTDYTASVRRMPTWLRFLKEGADLVGVLLFTTAFLGFIVQIFFRYVMNSPILWTEEVTMIAFVWTVFWAAASPPDTGQLLSAS